MRDSPHNSIRSNLSACERTCIAFEPVSILAEDCSDTEHISVVRIMILADQRLSLIPGAAAAKWQKQLPIIDLDREHTVIHQAQAYAAPLGLRVNAVGRIFELQMRVARDLQHGLYDKWRTAGLQFSGEVPDLDCKLRPELDRLTHDLLLALHDAAPVLQRDDFLTTYASFANAILCSAGWSVENRREFLEGLAALPLRKLTKR